MRFIRRYIKLYFSSFKMCLSREMVFRAHFLVNVFSEFIWISLSVFFLSVIYFHSGPIVGWRIEELVVLVGTSRIVSGLLEALFYNIRRLPDIVNRGDLDFFLTRPVDSQFLVSTRIFSLHGLTESIFGAMLVLVGLKRLRLFLTFGQVTLYAFLIICGLLMAYSLWFISVLPVFWLGRLDNIHHLFLPFLQLTRVPIGVFRGALKMIFTLVIPIAFMATVPTRTILGFFQSFLVATAVFLTVILLFLSHQVWNLALRRYSSASS